MTDTEVTKPQLILRSGVQGKLYVHTQKQNLLREGKIEVGDLSPLLAKEKLCPKSHVDMRQRVWFCLIKELMSKCSRGKTGSK